MDRRAFRRAEIGVLLVTVGGTLAVVTAELSRNAVFPGWAPFTLPTFEMALSIRPPIGASEDALDRWLADLWIAIAYGVTLVVYYLTLGAAVLGCLLIAHGAAEIRDESE